MDSPPAIQDWHWEITRSCNLRCTHCIIGGLETGEASTEASAQIINKIASLGGQRVFITGGEPFARKDLHSLLLQAKTLGISISIITNGTYQEATTSVISKGLIDQIGVSVEGTKRIHDLIRGSGSFRRTVATLSKIVATGKPVTVYLTINSLNLRNLDDIVLELIRLGVGSFHFNEINCEGRASKNSYLGLGELDLPEKLRIIRSQLDPIIELGSSPLDCSCEISPRSTYIDYKGVVYPCAELALHSPESSIGALLDANFMSNYMHYHTSTQIPRSCRYAVYNASGISICLNNTSPCTILKGG